MNINKMLPRTLLLAFAGTFVFSACEKDDTTQPEQITSVEVRLTGANGFDQKFVWSDPDGGDASNAVIDEIIIPASAGGTLQCQLRLYDDTQTPVKEVTEEIKAESNDHLFVYDVTGANLGIAYNDTDTEGNHFGVLTTWTKGAASSGALNIKLYHEPADKNNLNAPGGELDGEVSFQVTIE